MLALAFLGCCEHSTVLRLGDTEFGESDLVEERKVDIETAQNFANEYGINYFETSAHSGTGINEMMNDIMK